MNVNEAKLELALIEGELIEADKVDLITHLTNQGIPQEVINRISQLWETTKLVAGEAVSIGKIIIHKIWEFLQANPNIAAGMALGAFICLFIPILGPVLMPLAIAVGAVIGIRLDNYEQGNTMATDAIGVLHEVVMTARKFFEIFVEIVEAVKEYLK